MLAGCFKLNQHQLKGPKERQKNTSSTQKGTRPEVNPRKPTCREGKALNTYRKIPVLEQFRVL